MKSLSFILVAAVLSSFSFASAQSSCIGEAQIVAKYGSVKKQSLSDCILNVEAKSITYYNMSIICALDIDDVLQTGVSVGLKDGHDCAANPGDSFSGVLMRTSAGSIILDK